jgi:hypothetical protein
VGETRVDLLPLLEDLRDAYPGPTEATSLTAIVANSRDSRATAIDITTSPAEPTFTLVDDGAGMWRIPHRPRLGAGPGPPLRR